MKNKIASFLWPVILLANSVSMAGTLVEPSSVTGTGAFNNSVSLLFDGVIPDRATNFSDASNVNWQGTDPAFVFDYGSVVLISDVLIAADNNDSYLIEHSLDGILFSIAFEFSDAEGPQPPSGPGGGGLDILTTQSTFLSTPTDPTEPAYVGREFADISTRFLRVSSTGGDSSKAIGEFQAFSAIPIPSSFLLLLTSLVVVVRGRSIATLIE